MATNNNKKSGGLSLGFIVFVVFLILKLTHNIDWSWWWVTCPLWIGAAIWIGVAFIVGGFGLLAAIFSAIFGRRY